MAVLFPILQFFDNKGDVLSNGTITFYKANTTELGVVYTNQGAGTPLENPVLINSVGRPTTSGSIWLNGAYRISIKNSDGLLIYSADNVIGFNTVDWTGLTATLTQINSLVVDTTDVGNVRASKVVTTSAAKDTTGFNNLASVTLIANTSLKTPVIKDSNSLPAVTITAVPSQVNALTLTPAVASSSPLITSTGTDTNIDLNLASAGTTSKVRLNTYKLPRTDGANNDFISTDGAGTLVFTPRLLQREGSQELGRYSYFTSGSSIFDTYFTASSLPLLYAMPIFANLGYTSTALTVTPTSANSNLLIKVNVTTYVNSANPVGVFLVESNLSSPALAEVSTLKAASYEFPVTTSGFVSMNLQAVIPAVSTTTRYYRLNFLYANTVAAGTNGNNSAAVFGGVCASSITCQEILS